MGWTVWDPELRTTAHSWCQKQESKKRDPQGVGDGSPANTNRSLALFSLESIARLTLGAHPFHFTIFSLSTITNYTPTHISIPGFSNLPVYLLLDTLLRGT